MCLAQGPKPVRPMRLKPRASQTRVKHSTTEPLHSLKQETTGTQNKNLKRTNNGPYGISKKKVVSICLISTRICSLQTAMDIGICARIFYSGFREFT